MASAGMLDAAILNMKSAAQSFGGEFVSFFLEENTGHVGNNLTQQHATALVGAYGDWLARYRSRVAQCSSKLRQERSFIERNSGEIIQRLRYREGPSDGPTATLYTDTVYQMWMQRRHVMKSSRVQ